ncbi:hypothetical protein [Rhizomicrobium electricum]|uniref:IrrE N-terminal-like domain-containing protein n=1 Tax=Rhizomicrobium electricum TaxID=480070 RepID=A0ABN1FBK3_9PROT|nr:hypothetical protein [Rhizomicrobium electricum]NIJ50748.1 hypothetical protein [Rhizomicrobium electricum]
MVKNGINDDQQFRMTSDLERLRTPAQAYGGPLTAEQIEYLLRTVPGARRAAQGVFVELPKGFFHITHIRPSQELIKSVEDLDYYQICTPKETARLREIKTAHDYLLMIRANAIVENPRLLRVMAARRQKWEATGRRWSLSDYYASLNRAPKRYVARLARAQQRTIRAIPYGFSAVREANAICMRSLVGDVITASEMLREFFYFVVLCLTGANRDIDIPDCSTAGLIALRIMIGSEAQDFDLDPRCSPHPRLEAEIRGQVDAMLEFTFGHEFAHYLLGHLNGGISGENCIEKHPRDDEFAADRGAVLNVSEPKARRSMAEAAYMVFFALHLIDEVASVHSEVPRFSGSSSHPQPLDRIWSLHDVLGRADAPRRGALLKVLEVVARVKEMLLTHIGAVRPDILTFYGSLYLEGLGGRLREDRIEF